MTKRGYVEVEVVSFDRKLVKKSSFACGKPDLDTWLKQYAGQGERSNNTRTFLAVPVGDDHVIGYYATTTFRSELSDAAAGLGAGTRVYPVPASCWRGLPWISTGQDAGSGGSCLPLHCEASLRLRRPSALRW